MKKKATTFSYPESQLKQDIEKWQEKIDNISNANIIQRQLTKKDRWQFDPSMRTHINPPHFVDGAGSQECIRFKSKSASGARMGEKKEVWHHQTLYM